MSTAGSVRNAPPPPGSRIKLVRWWGILPIVGLMGVLSLYWVLFADRLIRDMAAEAATKLLGTEVDIAGVHLNTLRATLEVRGVQIADPFNLDRNLADVGTFHLALDPRMLLQKKIVIDQLSIRGVRTGSARARRAVRPKADGFAPAALREMHRFKAQFKVPVLELTPIDTLRAIALDPSQLASVRAAELLATRADSVRDGIATEVAALGLRKTLDSARSVGARLTGANPLRLGVDGTRRAIGDVRRTIAQIDDTKRRVESLERDTKSGAALLAEGVGTLDSARKADYVFARGLLKLPSFEGPDIGTALFGEVSIDRVQRILYWADLAQHYLPPGLLPRADPGPKRLRRAGTTVRYPDARHSPDFLVRSADLELTLPEGSRQVSYRARVLNVTTEPTILGKPAVFAARRDATAGIVGSVRLVGALDHTTARARDSVLVQAASVALPSFTLPSLPFRMEPRPGTVELRFVRLADSISARWHLRSDTVVWRSDTATRPLTRLQRIVGRVLSNVHTIDLVADIEGPIAAPRLLVRSNIDRHIGDGLRAAIGAEAAVVERRVRERVDRIAEEKAAPIRARVDSLRAEGEQKVAEARARLDEERARLEAQLKALTSSIGGRVRIPDL